MVSKRGRPKSTDTTDPATLRRRQLTAARTQQYRERQRRHQNQIATAAVPMTAAQGEQADTVARRPFDDVEVDPTVSGLGLRVQGLALGQDTHDAQLRHDALPIDEHNALYNNGDCGVPHPDPLPLPSASPSPPTLPLAPTLPSTQTFTLPAQVTRPPRTAQTTLASFFHTLPASNPFASTAQAGQAVDSGEQDGTISNNDEEEEAAGSGEEASVYSFLSEHSTNNTADGNTDIEEQEVSPLEYMVEKLYQQFQDGFHGCSSEQHDEELQQHMVQQGGQQQGGQHYGLGQLFNDPSFPSVLGLTGFIDAARLSRQSTPSPAQWEAMFCGVQVERSASRYPVRLCLHAEQTQAVEPQVSFDIDSFLGFASSLAMARQGIWYQPVPLVRQNITNDVHIKSGMAQDQGGSGIGGSGGRSDGGEPDPPPRFTLAPLKDIPHFQLGRVVGAQDIAIYVLFPYLARGEKFVALTKEQLSRWLDRIFLPAIHQYYEAHYTQHLPAGYEHALANSKASRVEGRRVETATYQMQCAIGYHLQPEFLHDVWISILDTIATTPGLGDFRQPQLFFSAKGTKLQFKTSPSRPTLLDAMENFGSYFDRYVDLDFVYTDRLYVDIGKEICARVSLLRGQQRHTDDEAQVYMWKRCCLKSNMRWMYDGEPPSDKGAGQRIYNQNMLRDACGLTSVAPRRSKPGKGGLVYSQYYCSVKEVSDIRQQYPFEHDGLEELALDPQIRQGARHIAGGRGSDIKVLEAAYLASKNRAHNALKLSRKKSFGIREEHRISWPLFQGILTRLRQEVDSGHDDLLILLDDCPSYAWAIKTDVYLHFLWRSADKFATGFEVIRAMCNRELVTWEQTKMMAMFLRCLRYVFHGHQLCRESALWWSRRERSLDTEEGGGEEGQGQARRLRVWYGLGFQNTLPKYGYCWLEPRIDWARLTFKPDVTDNVLFGNSILRRQYLRRGGHVRDFLATTRRLEIAVDWLNKHRDNKTIRHRLITWIVHICLQQFRIDILTTVASEIRPEYRYESLQGMETFSFDYLNEIMADGVHLVSGNRSRFKDVIDLGRFLFDYDDGRIRNHWEDRPFRKLYRRAHTALSLVPSNRRFHEVLWRWLLRMLCWYHWVLPYPCGEGLMQMTKQSQRMWYSIQRRSDGATTMTEALWEWSGKSYQPGEPPPLPQYVSWSKEEWEEWIEGEVRREEGRRQGQESPYY